MSAPSLSILDLTPVPGGIDVAEALRNTVRLAQAAEEMGYTRHWVAEHHNTPMMACPAPEVMVAQVAAATSRIRVGAGGVMLPNHSPLRIAEAFRVLEALHPGRIDLGIGRAPGTDGVTAFALRRGNEQPAFQQQLAELLAFAGRGFPDDHPFSRVRAEPEGVALPPIWILGSSEHGADVAAAIGAGFAFAHHLNPRGAVDVMRRYRERFAPGLSDTPHSTMTISAICADTRDRAVELSWSMALGVIRLRAGRPAPLEPPEVAEAHPYTEDEVDQVRRYHRAQVLGDPAEVAERLDRLKADTEADEIMIMTSVYDHDERVHSYRLIAEVLGVRASTPAS